MNENLYGMFDKVLQSEYEGLEIFIDVDVANEHVKGHILILI